MAKQASKVQAVGSKGVQRKKSEHATKVASSRKKVSKERTKSFTEKRLAYLIAHWCRVNCDPHKSMRDCLYEGRLIAYSIFNEE